MCIRDRVSTQSTGSEHYPPWGLGSWADLQHDPYPAKTMSKVDQVVDALGNLRVDDARNQTKSGANGVLNPRFLTIEEEGLLGNTTPDSFEMIDTVGTGTFGIVRLCALQGIERPFSMKILSKAQLLRLNQEVHVMAEREILGRVRHPFIVSLFRTYQTKSYLYMLMEFVPGGEVFYHLRRATRYPQSTAVFYAAQIVSVLEYLHGLRVAYRDLKPENLLIAANGYIRVVDFGFAKVIEQGTKSFTMCGTPEYLAPEIITTHGHGMEVDWWALGIFMYEMLVGNTPFYDDSQTEVYTKVLAGRVPFPSLFDSVAKDMIRRLLISDPSARIGCLLRGAEDVKRHKFFRGVDWERLHTESLPVPFVPTLKDPWDCDLFEQYPEDECALPAPGKLTPEKDALFKNF
eukprot:TRINITY_DN1462_c0_g1_i3.p1 TRINITY_DN1462_c0_g1~~TRINITY_DN1462_c0_g1_i3.p1  ORF type:complete len:403 (+),score=69.90 TRINITY_DN1462_c0_g1_i3:66-1274(+)